MKSFIKNHWETVYLTKDTTKVGWYQSKLEVFLDLIRKTSTPKDAAILDVGGGDSKLVDHLLEEGYHNLRVLDISETAIEKIKQRLGERQGQVKFVVSNILDFNPKEKIWLWYDRAVFHFLTDAKDQQNYRRLVEFFIPSGGCLIVATFSKIGPNTCSGLPVQQYDIQDLKEFFGQGFHLVEGINLDHITPSGSPQNYSVCLFRRN